jgi:hypothetical protein
MEKFKRIIFILARTIDYRIGMNLNDKPDLPILTFEEIVVSFGLRIFLFILEVTTCLLVIANILRNW